MQPAWADRDRWLPYPGGPETDFPWTIDVPRADSESRPGELFFDLVVVFAIIQVTEFLYDDPTWAGLLRVYSSSGTVWTNRLGPVLQLVPSRVDNDCVKRKRAWVTLVLSVGLLLMSSPALAVEQPPYQATVSRLDPDTRQLMRGSSWHPSCPVGLRDLRLVRLTYWGFDREAHRGGLVIHRRWADELVTVFRRIYRARFPIRRVRLVDRYGADDQISMRHDNTSAFNCRYVAGTTTWSQHAYGRAIDINPVENPYVNGSHVSPPNGEPYADRSRERRGMIYKGDVVWRAFRRIGWEWGGTWRSVQDYQHFSASGK